MCAKKFVKRRVPKHEPAGSVRASSTRVKSVILETGTLASMKAAKARTSALLAYHWKYYAELAFQRQQRQPALLAALREHCLEAFEFSKWQRLVKYKYGLRPFSTVGSLVDPGGRFNIGDLNDNIPSFPALYIAADRATAMAETLGQASDGSGLTAHERALASPTSTVNVSMSGRLSRVFDLRTSHALAPFAAIIKDFAISDELRAMAARIGEPPPAIIRDAETLRASLLEADWRVRPQRFDTPSNSQVFGHLLYHAQIEGVVYPSKFGGHACLAAYPHHFLNSTSYIQLDDAPPPEASIPRRLDASNWHICDETVA